MTVVEDLLRNWGVAPQQVTRPELGTMNEVFIVDTDQGRLVLRGHRQPDQESVDFELAVMAVARAGGVPAPKPLSTASGDLLVLDDGRWWSLLTWLQGDQPERGSHSREQACRMGEMLARIHSVLAPLPSRSRLPRSLEPTIATIRRAEELLAHIQRMAEAGADEAAACRWLSAQLEWLRAHVDDPQPEPDRHQTVHGDYHDANLVFQGDDVAGVLDWDKADNGSPLEEMIRAMHLAFSLDPELCRAFVAGYRTTRDLAADDLDRAARRYGFSRDRSIWLFDELFRGGNERLRPLLNHRPFLPFEASWRAVRQHL